MLDCADESQQLSAVCLFALVYLIFFMSTSNACCAPRMHAFSYKHEVMCTNAFCPMRKINNTAQKLYTYMRICACVDLRVVAIFSSAFKAILLKQLFEKVFLLRSGRKRTTLGAPVFNRLLFQPLHVQILRGILFDAHQGCRN